MPLYRFTVPGTPAPFTGDFDCDSNALEYADQLNCGSDIDGEQLVGVEKQIGESWGAWDGDEWVPCPEGWVGRNTPQFLPDGTIVLYGIPRC